MKPEGEHWFIKGKIRVRVIIQTNPYDVWILWKNFGPLLDAKSAYEFQAWLMPLIRVFDSDPRPSTTVNLDTGEAGRVFNDGTRYLFKLDVNPE